MREKQQKQMPLMNLPTGHPREIELEMISNILDETSTIYDLVLQEVRSLMPVALWMKKDHKNTVKNTEMC